MEQAKQPTPFSLALNSKSGKRNLVISFLCILAVILLIILKRIFGFELPFFVLVLPGFGSMVSMQMFANEANMIRMAMEEEERQKKH